MGLLFFIASFHGCVTNFGAIDARICAGKAGFEVTKGNKFPARTALNCTFERIGESPAEPLFKPFQE
jgi:hypothetical protein